MYSSASPSVQRPDTRSRARTGKVDPRPLASAGSSSGSRYALSASSGVHVYSANPAIGCRSLKRRTQVGSVSAYQRLVVKPASPDHQNASGLEWPRGRMAPRSLRDTESARERGSALRIQSISTEPRKRYGDAGVSLDPMSGVRGSGTPSSLRMIPVDAGHRPAIITAWPGAVSVIM